MAVLTGKCATTTDAGSYGKDRPTSRTGDHRQPLWVNEAYAPEKMSPLMSLSATGLLKSLR